MIRLNQSSMCLIRTGIGFCPRLMVNFVKFTSIFHFVHIVKKIYRVQRLLCRWEQYGLVTEMVSVTFLHFGYSRNQLFRDRNNEEFLFVWYLHEYVDTQAS